MGESFDAFPVYRKSNPLLHAPDPPLVFFFFGVAAIASPGSSDRAFFVPFGHAQRHTFPVPPGLFRPALLCRPRERCAALHSLRRVLAALQDKARFSRADMPALDIPTYFSLPKIFSSLLR